MTTLFKYLLLVSFLFSLKAPTLSAAEPRVENFALIDHEGKFHEFDYYRRNPEVKGIVLFIQGNGCPLVRKRILELNNLRLFNKSKGLRFLMLNANIQDEREDIANEVEEFKITYPVLKDDSQLVANMLGVTRTAEALLIDTKARKIVFRGPIDDRMSYQAEKPKATKTYLKDAIKSFLAGEEIAEPKVDAPGCKITMDAEKEISYAQEVAPILKKRCIECHTRGGVGPFAMSSYKKVKGWSEMMAEMILTKQMPPWHADPHHGKYSNASSLTEEETKTLVRWIRAGSPRGEGDDPLANYQPEIPEWKLGKPDKIISLPVQKIPAEGVLPYRYAYIDSPFDRDVWVSAAELNPGSLQVLHHAIVVIEDQSDRKRGNIRGHWLTGYAPGTDPAPYPKNTGVLLKKNQRLKVQLHYTVSGRSTEDTTRIGLHLLEEPPAKVFRTWPLSHHRWVIPAGEPEFEQAAKPLKIPASLTLYGINPHMHFRGKRMKFTLRKPDGTRQVLLSVPNYNFNWQRTYILDKPISVPAGSQILVENAWDNSPQNPFNPDPSKPVKWGDQTDEEMFFATFTFVLND